MDHSDGVTQAPAGTVVPQELLEEMLWVFRVEDGKLWRAGGRGGGVCSSTQGVESGSPLWQAAHFPQGRY